MEVPRLRELLEVSDVRGDEDAILLERLLQDFEVRRPWHCSIANVRGVDSFDGFFHASNLWTRSIAVEPGYPAPRGRRAQASAPSSSSFHVFFLRTSAQQNRTPWLSFGL